MKQYQYNDLEALQGLVSDEFGAWSEEVEVTQDLVNQFAELTGDNYWIHTDPEKAKTDSPFGATIAHGFLTLSMLSHIATQNGITPEGVVMGINYGFDKVRFLAPVRAGKRVRAHRELLSVDQKDDNRFLLKHAVTVEIEGEETPALVAEWLGMMVVA